MQWPKGPSLESPGRQTWGSRSPMAPKPQRGVTRVTPRWGFVFVVPRIPRAVALGFRVAALWAKPQTILPIRQRSRHALLRPCQPMPETKSGSYYNPVPKAGFARNPISQTISEKHARKKHTCFGQRLQRGFASDLRRTLITTHLCEFISE